MGERIAALPEQAASDLFDRKVLRRLVDEHRAATHDHSEVLWTVLNFQTWKETFNC